MSVIIPADVFFLRVIKNYNTESINNALTFTFHYIFSVIELRLLEFLPIPKASVINLGHAIFCNFPYTSAVHGSVLICISLHI